MTVDEELTALDESVRRLKVEYDVFFGGGSKKPPEDTEWRVKNLIKRHGDTAKLNYAQRFRYNTIVQRYAVYSDLWRQKMKIKEEGYRRPQDALLSIQGIRTGEEHAAAEALSAKPADPGPFSIRCSESEDPERVKALFNALAEAKLRLGQTRDSGTLSAFAFFIRLKTEQIRREYGCHTVEYVVEVVNGQVKLKARAGV